MAIQKIGLVMATDNLHTVYDNQNMTALQVAAAASAKVDECVEMVNGVEQSAIEATAVVDEMRIVQEQFVTETTDLHNKLETENQAFIDTLTADKTTFETGLNASKATFEGNMNAALTDFENGLDNSKATFEGNMNTALTNFENGLNTSKADLEADMAAAIQTTVDGADATIVTATNEKIDTLVESGAVGDIIKKHYDEMLDGNMTVSRIFSSIRKCSTAFPDTEYYTVPQSICFIEGQNKLMLFLKADEPYYSSSERIQIEEYSYPDMTLLRSKVLSIGHGNGATYDKTRNKLYVCPIDSENSGIYVVDYTNLTIDLFKGLPFNPHGCAMDNVNDKLYLADGDLIYSVNPANLQIIDSFTLQLPPEHGIITQDMEFYNGYIYKVYWRPNTINVFDLTGKNIINYNVPNYWNKIYRIMECESICHVGNGRFLISAFDNFETNHYTTTASIGVTDFKKEVADEPLQEIDFHSETAATDLYVDARPTNVSTNPVGTALSPFRSVQEALSVVNAPFITGRINIYLVGGVEPYPLQIMGINKPIKFINNTGGYYEFDNIQMYQAYNVDMGVNGLKIVSKTVATDALRIEKCNNIQLYNMQITKNGCTNEINIVQASVSHYIPNGSVTPAHKLNTSKLTFNSYFDSSKIEITDSMSELNNLIKCAETGAYTATFALTKNIKLFKEIVIVILEGTKRNVHSIFYVAGQYFAINGTYFTSANVPIMFRMNFQLDTDNQFTISNLAYMQIGVNTFTAGTPPEWSIENVFAR